MTKQLILASGSPYRRAQLQQLGLPFDCMPTNIDETIPPEETARDAALRLSVAKAAAVMDAGNVLVIGSDQTAALDDRILGKPLSIENAVDQLKACSGRQVIFYSGLCLLDGATGAMRKDCIATTVSFRKLTEWQIHNYIDREQPLDCAGSFKCEGLGIALFESISSDDPSALIGLPLIALNKMLLSFGVDALNP